jgi:aerobic carbon-monoxide dehydrogenase medium subunit
MRPRGLALCARYVILSARLPNSTQQSYARGNHAMRYEAPDTIEAAAKLLAAEDNAKVLAGGTDLLVQMRSEIVTPSLLVDIKRISELRRVTEEAGGFRIGAAVTGAELKEHPKLSKVWPGVIEAANLIGSTQVQGRATMGGNLCNGSPAADSVPALIAAGAVATVVGPNGRRELKVEDVVLGPRKLALTKGEIIASFLLPKRPPKSADAYLRFIPRTEMDIAVVGCGVNLTLDGSGTCTAARVALGAVAARPLLVDDAAKALIGTKLDQGALAKLEAAARAACKPIDDKRGTVEFRVDVAGVLARRTAQIALERARKS